MAISHDSLRPTASQISVGETITLMEIPTDAFVKWYMHLTTPAPEAIAQEQYVRQPLEALDALAGGLGGLSMEAEQNLPHILKEITEVFGTPYLLQMIASLYNQELLENIRPNFFAMQQHAEKLMYQLDHEGTENYLLLSKVIENMLKANLVRPEPKKLAFAQSNTRSHTEQDALAVFIGPEATAQYRQDVEAVARKSLLLNTAEQAVLQQQFEEHVQRTYVPAVTAEEPGQRLGVLGQLVEIYSKYVDHTTAPELYADIAAEDDVAIDKITQDLWEKNTTLRTFLYQTQPLLESAVRHRNKTGQEKNTLFIMATADTFFKEIMQHSTAPESQDYFKGVSRFSHVFADLGETYQGAQNLRGYSVEVESFNLKHAHQRPINSVTTKEMRLNSKSVTPTLFKRFEEQKRLLQKRGKMEEETALSSEEVLQYKLLRAVIKRRVAQNAARVSLAATV